jgi:copper homeostasis protein CutC
MSSGPAILHYDRLKHKTARSRDNIDMGTIISETKDNITIMRGASVNAASQNGTLLDLMGPKYIHRFDISRDDELLQVSVELPYFLKSYPPDLNEA